MDFGALPPEINSARMYAGPGPGSMSAAAAAWDGLASELHSAASSYRSVIAGLTTGKWMGPSSLAMASAFGPYVAWTAGAAARATEAASHARLAVEIYEAAFAMTVPPPAVTANRVQLATLIATNFFGQNSVAIAAAEAEYGEMWAQDATAMYQYAADSVAAAEVTTFTSPPNVTNPVGVAQQAVAAEVTAVQGSVKSALTNLVSSLPATLQSLTSPATAASSTSNISSTLSTVFSSTTLSNAAAQITSDLPQYAATYFMAAATPLYGMSSILGMAQTAQGLANAAGQGVAAAAQGAANAAASGAGAVESLGRGVVGSIGSAATLGPLAVPASWTSVIPTAHMGAAAALPNAGIGGANLPPSLLGGLPRTAAPRTAPGPRYGIVPTAMTRPPSAG